MHRKKKVYLEISYSTEEVTKSLQTLNKASDAYISMEICQERVERHIKLKIGRKAYFFPIR